MIKELHTIPINKTRSHKDTKLIKDIYFLHTYIYNYRNQRSEMHARLGLQIWQPNQHSGFRDTPTCPNISKTRTSPMRVLVSSGKFPLIALQISSKNVFVFFLRGFNLRNSFSVCLREREVRERKAECYINIKEKKEKMGRERKQKREEKENKISCR